MKRPEPIFVMILAALLGMMSACTNLGKGEVSIQGSFPGLKGKTIILSRVGVDRVFPIDTTQVSDNGHYKFRVNIDSAGYYIIKADNRNYIMLVLDNDAKVKVSSDSNPISENYKVEGSEDSEFLEEFQKYDEKNKAIIDSVKNVYSKIYHMQAYSAERATLDDTYQKVFEDQQNYVRNFITQHCSSLASLLVIDRRFGQRQILTYDQDYKYYFDLDSCLNSRYPGNPHVIAFHDKVERIHQQRALQIHMEKKLAVGKKAPDLKMETPAKKTVDLYSLKSKCILVYFWSSSDTSSRNMNKKLTYLYDTYSSKGFKVYAVAIESYMSMWEDAIKSDGLKWINVSDLMNKYSSACVLYNTQDRLPYFYLLDDNFIIRYKGDDLRSLETELRKLTQ